MTHLKPIQAKDLKAFRHFARSIWYEYYSNIISLEQIEYMLMDKYSDSDVFPYIDSSDRWLEILCINDMPAGFIRCSKLNDGEFKLHEIYLTSSQRGNGLGQRLLARVEELALQHQCKLITLYVNRNNRKAIGAYERAGYAVTRSDDFDIGGGFFMNDYHMQKQLF